jgi:hypothetical protein
MVVLVIVVTVPRILVRSSTRDNSIRCVVDSTVQCTTDGTNDRISESLVETPKCYCRPFYFPGTTDSATNRQCKFLDRRGSPFPWRLQIYYDYLGLSPNYSRKHQ